jgi:hypothetical protein
VFGEVPFRPTLSLSIWPRTCRPRGSGISDARYLRVVRDETLPGQGRRLSVEGGERCLGLRTIPFEPWRTATLARPPRGQHFVFGSRVTHPTAPEPWLAHVAVGISFSGLSDQVGLLQRPIGSRVTHPQWACSQGTPQNSLLLHKTFDLRRSGLQRRRNTSFRVMASTSSTGISVISRMPCQLLAASSSFPPSEKEQNTLDGYIECIVI